tara:strand:- start:158 stop:508 length:351 start_codon:yes stop_codon:yes gene_type:complete
MTMTTMMMIGMMITVQVQAVKDNRTVALHHLREHQAEVLQGQALAVVHQAGQAVHLALVVAHQVVRVLPEGQPLLVQAAHPGLAVAHQVVRVLPEDQHLLIQEAQPEERRLQSVSL